MLAITKSIIQYYLKLLYAAFRKQVVIWNDKFPDGIAEHIDQPDE